MRRVKPDPELYLTSVEKLGTSPDRTLAIEDSPNGVASAKQAGLLCVAVPNQMTKDIPLDQADLRVESLADIPLRALLSNLTQKQHTG